MGCQSGKVDMTLYFHHHLAHIQIPNTACFQISGDDRAVSLSSQCAPHLTLPTFDDLWITCLPVCLAGSPSSLLPTKPSPPPPHSWQNNSIPLAFVAKDRNIGSRHSLLPVWNENVHRRIWLGCGKHLIHLKGPFLLSWLFGMVFWCSYHFDQVDDKGSAIRGPFRIDLYHHSHSDALQWGRRKVKVCLLMSTVNSSLTSALLNIMHKPCRYLWSRPVKVWLILFIYHHRCSGSLRVWIGRGISCFEAGNVQIVMEVPMRVLNLKCKVEF